MTQSKSSNPKSSPSTKNMLDPIKKDVMQNNIVAGAGQFTVVKRNGTISPFRKERIFKAIEAAFRDTKKLDQKIALPDDILCTVEEITDQVTTKSFELAANNVSLTVEGIQDLVEVTLMKNGLHDVARDYIIYRDSHKAVRKDDPSLLKIYRNENQSPVKFNPIKIASSLEKIFQREQCFDNLPPEAMIEAVNALTQAVIKKVVALGQTEEKIHLYHIQNLVEEELMRSGYFQAAKNYILYRAEKKNQEFPDNQSKLEKKKKRVAKKGERSFKLIDEQENEQTLSESEILDKIDYACEGFESIVKSEDILESTILNFYEGMKLEELDQALIMSCRSKIEKDPAYAKITARFLLDKIYKEVLGVQIESPNIEQKHMEYFKDYIKKGVELGRLDQELEDFDLNALAKAIDINRSDQFLYLGLQTIYDRYLIHENEKRLETPQIFWMRVAMGLCIKEKEKTQRAIEFYNILSTFKYLSATPTLFNSGTTHSQLSSCYLSTTLDDLGHIFKTISDDAQLSKWAGGLGNDWTNVRGTGAHIKGTNGQSQGVVPFLKVANDTAVAVNQGGKRKGAMCSYLETWHIDIEDFLELRKNTGDDRRRTHDMNTANWIPDLFMKRVKSKGKWTLFSPDQVPDLHDLYGKAFEARYVEYERQAKEGKISLFKELEALDLWKKMLGMLFETGHPWITFKDPSNIRSPQDHAGTVHSSNLCTEILLNTSKEETAVCNLGSINLVAHITEEGIDERALAITVTTGMRMLDNVIDVNKYPIPEAKTANMAHRAVGIGLMGFQDALNILGISYASHEAVKFADKTMEMISYYAILASSELAKERNPYPSYKGSKWEKGLLPIDTIDLLEQEREEKILMDRSTTMDWEKVRESIRKHGMRNSNTMAIAPTATIANIAGVSPCIEPYYKLLFVKANLSGDFTIYNPYLVESLKKINLWDDQMIDDLKYFDGSISEIERIPEEIKKLYLTSFEIDPEWILECASRRQKWIDQGQSLNLYISEPSGKKLNDMYFSAWNKGLKTTYYLRGQAATQVEKSTIDINKRAVQPRWMKNESPSARVKIERKENTSPSMPVCNLEEGCESCQ